MFGQRVKAEQSLKEALTFSERHRLNEYRFNAEAALTALNGNSAPRGQDTLQPRGAEDSTEWSEITEKLHALRAS